MDPKTLTAKLDRILALRGDPTSGVGKDAWSEALADVDRETLTRALITAVRELLVPYWVDMHKNDPRPQKALDAAEKVLDTKGKSPEAIAEAKAAAKACTEAKNETFGTDHRVPEAARAAAWSTTKPDSPDLFEGLGLVEHELLARVALTGEYHRGPEQRRAIVAILKRALLPPEPVAAPPPSLEPPGPVPYSPEGHFELGQTLIHKKFGDVTVTSVGETWIEVQIPDGTKKRLAHKP